jgi:hypothetical protein
LTADNASAIFTYGTVVTAAGAINGGSTAPAAGTLGTTSPLGICMGVQYTSPGLQYTLNAQYLPANAITAGYTNILVSVLDDPNALFMIQADGQVAQDNIGQNINLNSMSGNVTTGFSTTSAIASTAGTTNTFPLRIVDLVNQNSIFGGGLSAPNDAFTDVIVRWNLNTHVWSFQLGQ